MQTKMAVLAVAVVALAGCGQVDELADATPELDTVALQIAGEASEGTATQALVSAAAEETTPPELLVAAREAARKLNAALRDALGEVRAIVESGDYVEGERPNSRIYAPVTHGNVQYRLSVAKLGRVLYGWKLEAAPAGVESPEWQRFMAGTVTVDGIPHRGRGTLGLNLDVLAGIDADFPGQGRLRGAYAHVRDGVALAFALDGFTPNPETYAPVNATFVGHRNAGVFRARVVARHDLDQTSTDAKELVLVRVRHTRGIGGRADAVAFEGDIPAGQVYVGSMCWDSAEVPVFKVLRACSVTVPRSCEVVYEEGDASACGTGLRTEETPDLDPTDAAQEPGSSDATLTPPTDMPTGDAT